MQVERQPNSSAVIFVDSEMVQKRKLQKNQQNRLEKIETDVRNIKRKIELISKVLENVRFEFE